MNAGPSELRSLLVKMSHLRSNRYVAYQRAYPGCCLLVLLISPFLLYIVIVIDCCDQPPHAYSSIIGYLH
jgi:hypothetical protein